MDNLPDSEAASRSNTVGFKPRKRKNLRKRINEEDAAEDEEISSTLEELREVQKLKKRVNHGVNVEDLLKKKEIKNEKVNRPIVNSGITSVKEIVASELDLGNTFSVETNRRDEDAEMSKFIEEELRKRTRLVETKRSSDGDDGDDKTKTKKLILASSPDDMVFNVLPEHLLNAGKTIPKNEEMLSSQMLSGIPEIDLGLDERIRNIEATEEAKMKHLYNRKQVSKASNLVPSNIAVNFTSNRIKPLSDETPFLVTAKEKTPTVTKPVVTLIQEPVVVIGDEPRTKEFKEYKNSRELRHPGRDKASDDYHFSKFRKQHR